MDAADAPRRDRVGDGSFFRATVKRRGLFASSLVAECPIVVAKTAEQAEGDQLAHTFMATFPLTGDEDAHCCFFSKGSVDVRVECDNVGFDRAKHTGMEFTVHVNNKSSLAVEKIRAELLVGGVVAPSAVEVVFWSGWPKDFNQVLVSDQAPKARPSCGCPCRVSAQAGQDGVPST